jgi:hypothetical protein
MSEVQGWENVGVQLLQIYLPHFKDTQVLNLLGSISGIKSIITLGSELRDFITVPYTQYIENGELATGIIRFFDFNIKALKRVHQNLLPLL